MSRLSSSIVALCIGVMALSTAAIGCADSETATLTLPLYTEADYFTLDIYGPDGANLYTTGCLLRQARTFRVSNLERVDNALILFHYYSDVSCDDSAHVGVGVRGEVTVVKGEERYYHIPVLADGDVTALPIDQNVSAGFATEVTYCETDNPCTEPGAEGLCKKAFDDGTQKYKYWCVPSCDVDSDCTGLHPAASCDKATNWCMISSPYPLNMSSARAFGQAVTAPNGDPLLIGGFSELSDGALSASGDAIERYNAATGLFQVEAWEGDSAANIGQAGIVTLARAETTQVALVGGASGATLGPDGPHRYTGASGDIVILDLDEESVVVHEGATEPVVSPGVLAVGAALVVVGGWRADDSGALASSAAISRCAADGADYTCTEIGSLTTARTSPSVSCLDDSCDQLLVVGGNTDGPVAEVIDFTSSTMSPELTSMASPGLPAVLHFPVVCSGKLLGGGDADGQGFLPLTIDGDASVGVLSVNELENLDGIQTSAQAAVFEAADGDCWVFGGRDMAGAVASTAVWRATNNAVVSAGTGVTLDSGRYGAVVAAIGSGELAGSVLIAGGLTLSDELEAGEFVSGAEIFRP